MAFNPEHAIKDTPMVKRAVQTVSATVGSEYRKDPFGLLLWITLTFTVILGLFGRHITWEVHVIIVGLTVTKAYVWFLTDGYKKPFFSRYARKSRT